MTQIVEGPGFSIPKFNNQLDVGFRVISDYQVQTDSVVTRFDVSIGGPIVKPGDKIYRGEKTKQFNVSINSTEPGVSSLLTPARVLGCVSIQTSAKELIAALRGLADKLEETTGHEPVNPGDLK